MDDYKPEKPNIKQSPPIDVTVPYDAAWVKDKVIVITGGASGFGAGFVRLWANNGAVVIVGDINVQKGDALCRAINKESNTGGKAHFVHCDVTDWQSQVNLFKEAVKLSPHGGLDCVVANAGIAGPDNLQMGSDLDAAEPPPPVFKIMDVNLTGVLYTTHLACFWLPKNPGSSPCSLDAKPSTTSPRDRHILLLGSIASLAPIAIQPQYCAAKHAVLGLFRSLRVTSGLQGIRVNLLCPYFIDTPIVTTGARFILAGGALGQVEDVVDAGTRFVADSRILGRALCVGPKMHVRQKENGEWELSTPGAPGSIEQAIFEPCADDWEDQDQWNRTFVKLLNLVQAGRGWIGWAQDIAKATLYSREDPNVIDLYYNKLDTIHNYVRWLYNGIVPVQLYIADDDEDRETRAEEAEKVFVQLAYAYVFGERAFDSKYRNAVIKTIFAAKKYSIIEDYVWYSSDERDKGVDWTTSFGEYCKEALEECIKGLMMARTRPEINKYHPLEDYLDDE
ncbi:Bacilysin biosynthesis oxidoreductase bacC [Pyrenophora tritici-repentis]|nr:Bacilysin biosynthesis oxidoreductase bacC [Pyrenophora tritici-repentis]